MKLALTAFLTLYGSLAYANDEHLGVSQESNDHIIATIFAKIPSDCPAPTTFEQSRSNGTFSIITFIATSCLEPDGNTPYQGVVDLGSLPDGAYTVDWFYANGFGPFGQALSLAFSVRNGQLVTTIGIPTLSWTSVAFLLLLIVLASWQMHLARIFKTNGNDSHVARFGTSQRLAAHDATIEATSR